MLLAAIADKCVEERSEPYPAKLIAGPLTLQRVGRIEFEKNQVLQWVGRFLSDAPDPEMRPTLLEPRLSSGANFLPTQHSSTSKSRCAQSRLIAHD